MGLIMREDVLRLLDLGWKKGIYPRDNIALLPIIDTEPRWIPISERLPEEYDYVLVSTDREEVFTADYMGVIGGDHCFDDSNGDMYEGEVIAWMPMPKPYSREG